MRASAPLGAADVLTRNRPEAYSVAKPTWAAVVVSDDDSADTLPAFVVEMEVVSELNALETALAPVYPESADWMDVIAEDTLVDIFVPSVVI